MLTPALFERLTLEERVGALARKGVCLLERKNYLFSVFLYAIDRLFVEVWYFNINNGISKIKVIDGNEVCSLYLDKLNLDFEL